MDRVEAHLGYAADDERCCGCWLAALDLDADGLCRWCRELPPATLAQL